jgi:pimeloyl-ACP methyl ester carboxylesterase
MDAYEQASAGLYPPIYEAFRDKNIFDICEVWESEPPPPLENQPVVSDIPTLILSGESDPITPPSWGQAAAGHLSQGQFFVFPGIAHRVLGADRDRGNCSMDMLDAFLADPTTPLDTTCLDAMELPPFEE